MTNESGNKCAKNECLKEPVRLNYDDVVGLVMT